MAICANDKGVLVGRMTRLFLAEGCGDAVPDAEDWKYLGSTTSKGVDYSPQTTTSESPARMERAPSMTDFMPEPQTMPTV